VRAEGTPFDGENAMRCVVLILCLFWMTACHRSPTGPSVPLNTDFELAPGSSAFIEAAAVAIRFNRVIGDSRCPGDAICVQGGDAIVHLTVTSTRGSRDHELHTGSMAPVTHDDLTISLVQLAPYPFGSRGPIQPHEYRATLTVAR